MRINQGFAANGRGWVRAVFSRRAGGFAAPVDLVKKQLHAANACAGIGRLRAAFASYLVTDDEAGYPFHDSREKYAPRRVGVMGTGFPLAAEFGGDIDAPDWSVAGSMGDSLNVPFPTGVRRSA